MAEAAEQLYKSLWDQGIETLYDDRPDAAAGVKFNDADLLGFPLRLVVSPRNLRNGMVEMKGRQEDDATMVSLEEVAAAVKNKLAEAVPSDLA